MGDSENNAAMSNGAAEGPSRTGPSGDPTGALRALGDVIGRGFAGAAQAMLGWDAQATLVSADERTCAAFVASCSEPTCCFAICSESQHDPRQIVAWMELPYCIALAAIDRLLGGPGDVECLPRRALTAVERRLLRRMLDGVGRELGRHFEATVGQGSFRSLDATQRAVVATFELTLGGHVGPIRLCVGADVLQLPLPARPGGSAKLGPIELAVALESPGQDQPGLPDELAVGDILASDVAPDAELTVRIAGIPKLTGRLCAAAGKRAVRLTGGAGRGKPTRDDDVESPDPPGGEG